MEYSCYTGKEVEITLKNGEIIKGKCLGTEGYQISFFQSSERNKLYFNISIEKECRKIEIDEIQKIKTIQNVINMDL